MSIASERIEASGFGCVMECACDTSRFESSPMKERKEVVLLLVEEEEEDDWRSSSSTTTSSSIGRNSDDVSGRSSDVRDFEENEVQSAYKGGLDMMDSLQQFLPMRRGISSFYNGKSKSFTSLADASSASSIREIAKPENAYTRRRRNLLAINHVWDKNRNKRPIKPISSSKSTLALAVTMGSSESISSTSDDSTSASSPRLPPLHPQTRTSFNNNNNNNNNTPSSPPSSSRSFSDWRSFSLADVRGYTTVMETTNPHCSLINDRTNYKKGI
ncbi:nuclear transcription factor Y subunit alpha-like [Durio zibethinus]|uniref:Nuclear transcription factor Y subunit alpha-like n=1 Tax=Durio zibethinus TaxID=66656 RepID=A0A6P5ZHF0_DURZI|nr:nuclear transcription factor Y subunit alpha-like [Durio zibethinus]